MQQHNRYQTRNSTISPAGEAKNQLLPKMMRSLICVTLGGVMLPRLELAAGQLPPNGHGGPQTHQMHDGPSTVLPALVITKWPKTGAANPLATASGELLEISGFAMGINTNPRQLKALLFLESAQLPGSWSLAGFKPVLRDGSFSFAVHDASWPQARIVILPPGTPVTPLAGGPLPAALDEIALLAASYARDYVPAGGESAHAFSGELGRDAAAGLHRSQERHMQEAAACPPAPVPVAPLPPKSPSWTPDPQAQPVRTPPPPPPSPAASPVLEEGAQPQVGT